MNIKHAITILVTALLAFISFPSLAQININTATKAQLQTLDRIGPNKAAAIIKYRKENGKFKKLADLQNVPGIGENTYKKLKGKITIKGKSATSAAKEKKKQTKAKTSKKKNEIKKEAAKTKKSVKNKKSKKKKKKTKKKSTS